MLAPAPSHRPRHPESTTLYAVVRDNLATLYGAVDDGAVSIALPAFVKKELEGFLECGLACRGLARLRCEACGESRLVSFSCKGRGFCPSCLGRRMASTAANSPVSTALRHGWSGRPGDFSPGLPRIRTCPIRASGSSRHGVRYAGATTLGTGSG